MSKEVLKLAQKIIKVNDFGTYTIPTDKLYPFQWNWDSCLVALGISYLNEDRAWIEIETLFKHQWADGMVPHIIFHKKCNNYFPGPEVWETTRDTPTSGITQPPIAGYIVHQLYKKSKNKPIIKERISKLLHLIVAWHDWFFNFRDPKSTGLVSIIHPWESGRDNSLDWDNALDKVPSSGPLKHPRKDTKLVNKEQRPTDKEYSKYIALVQLFKENKWNNEILHKISPFQVIDPGFNAILFKSCYEIGLLAQKLGFDEISDKSFSQAQKGINALETLWDNSRNRYNCFDRKNKKLIHSNSIGGIFPIFANIPKKRANDIASSILQLEKKCNYLVPSHDPSDDKFDSLRYWKGPAWLIANYIVTVGLRQSGNNELADRIISDSIALVKKNSFAEYYDPINGSPCGGNTFSWTAAMAIEFILNNVNKNIKNKSM